MPRANRRSAERRKPRSLPRWAGGLGGRLRGGDAERGSASIEFITAGMLLLVPLLYLVVAIAAIQSASLGLEGAGRQAARVYARADTVAEANRRAAAVIAVAAADHGLDATRIRMQISCAPQPRQCLRPRGRVTVRLDYSVPLPLLPAALGDWGFAAVPLSATATQPVSRFGGVR